MVFCDVHARTERNLIESDGSGMQYDSHRRISSQKHSHGLKIIVLGWISEGGALLGRPRRNHELVRILAKEIACVNLKGHQCFWSRH